MESAGGEGKKGSIGPGESADLVVLADDLLTLREDRINTLVKRSTLVGGRLVHEMPPTPHRCTFDNVGIFR
jgi:predicted amidohydrolase YtcJ